MKIQIKWSYGTSGETLIGIAYDMDETTPFMIKHVHNHLILQYGMITIYAIDLAKYVEDDDGFENDHISIYDLLERQHDIFEYAENFLVEYRKAKSMI